jgi:hypothetical protein
MYVYATALEAATAVVFVGWLWAYSNPKPTPRFFNLQHFKSVTNLDIYKGFSRMHIRLSYSGLSFTWQSASLLCKNQPRFWSTTYNNGHNKRTCERCMSVSAPADTMFFLTSHTYYCIAVSRKNLCLHHALFLYTQGHNIHDILDYIFRESNIIINLNHKTKENFIQYFSGKKVHLMVWKIRHTAMPWKGEILLAKSWYSCLVCRCHTNRKTQSHCSNNRQLLFQGPL